MEYLLWQTKKKLGKIVKKDCQARGLNIVHEPDQIMVPPGRAKPTNDFLKALCL